MAGITFTESSKLADSVFGSCQAPIRLFLEKKAEAYEQESMVKHIFTMEQSTHAQEAYTSMTGTEGFAPVGESGEYPRDSIQEGHKKVLTNMTWKNSFSVSQEAVEDAVSMSFKKAPTAFLADYHRTREQFGAALLAAAVQGKKEAGFRGRSFDATGADGLPFFSKAHPSAVDPKLTQCNLFENPFSEDALGLLETRMQSALDDKGNILGLSPDTIIIPNDHSLKKAVFAAIGADKDPGTANNGFNYLFGRWSVIVWPYLDELLRGGAKPWLLMDSSYNETAGCAIWQERVALSVRSELASNDDNLWKGRARFTAGFNDWRGFAAGGVTGGETMK